jgi:broad specificity phosphatase PhoE
MTERKKGPRLILLVRHCEKPAQSLGEPGLSALGKQHAIKLATTIPKMYGVPDVVFAAASDAESTRCVDSATPIVDLLRIPFHSGIPAGDVTRLVSAIENLPVGDFVLVVWRHEQLPAISAALGFPPPFKKWPQEDYSTQWALKRDGSGVAAIETENRPTREGLPIVAGKPYDEEEVLGAAILRGIDKGIAARAAEKKKLNP